jgi:uncharacterized phiE125 gp8 family phage protein
MLERDSDGNVLPHEDDALIESEIKAATAHYEGWAGILGLGLVEQTWRQDLDAFACRMRLPLRPVSEVLSVKWRNSDGQISTVASANYALETDAGGESIVWLKRGFVGPSNLYGTGAVQIEFRAGWPVLDGVATTPADIKAAIKLRVAASYDEAAKAGAQHLERMEAGLLAKYRPWRV